MDRTSLPIDAHLDEAAALLAGGATLIVEAPPGAGKTTRLPAHLLDQDWCTGKVLVTEPRRIAARLAATRVASERGCRVGAQVGYRVRFDDQTSAQTRLIYLTEGLLLRELLSGTGLQGVSAVVLDEVHERSADLDVTLALLKDMRSQTPDLRLVLMSATLDAARLKAHFPEADMISSPGQSFDVEIHHAPKDDERPLPIQVRSAVKEALERAGDVLVFLPGGGEIRACENALEQLSGIEIVPLHGDLPLNEQSKAMSPGRTRRVVLSTNVAESSVTIPGITTVIDTGLARTAVFDRWSGVSRLETIAISQARCIQRAGRAGRVAPGQAIRLFTRGSFSARPAQDQPELLREDLSSVLLMLKAAGKAPQDLKWLSPPEDSAWRQASELLTLLGALEDGLLTRTGKDMAQLPVAPRLARVAVEGARRGVTQQACRAAALLSERDIVQSTRRFRPGGHDVVASDSDIEDRLDRLDQLEGARFDRRLARDLDVDLRSAQQVSKLARSLEKHLRPGDASRQEPAPHALSLSLLAGFVDRVAERRGYGKQLVLCGGTQAALHETSSVIGAPLLLALSADAPGGQHRKAQVRLACRIEPDWLLDVVGEHIVTSETLEWAPARSRVEQTSRISYEKITLDESTTRAFPSPEAAALLVKAALAKGPAVYDPESRLEALFVRLSLLCDNLADVIHQCSDEEREVFDGLRVDNAVSEERFVELALGAAAQSRTTLQELAEANLEIELAGYLPPAVARTLTLELPTEARLKGGHRLRVHYEKGRAPWIESRLQDFFSMTETPTICRGRVPLQLHLLAPNKRAVQVTTDLPGFWERHYPDLRKQLMRRYPKHLWPEDGRTAKPPQPGRIR